MRLSSVARALALAVLAASPAGASDRRQKQLEFQLKKLDPQTRLEQVCDIEAMKRIAKDNREFKIDRSVISAIEEPRVKGDTITGKGAAFRSKGKWYRYAFTCSGTPDRMQVLSFEYKLGDEIPETQWSKHGLYQ
jgi:hypothetical protein